MSSRKSHTTRKCPRLRVAISTVSDPSGSGRVDMLTGPVAAARAVVATGGWVKSKRVYDTWKCGSFSFIFTHPPKKVVPVVPSETRAVRNGHEKSKRAICLFAVRTVYRSRSISSSGGREGCKNLGTASTKLLKMYLILHYITPQLLLLIFPGENA